MCVGPQWGFLLGREPSTSTYCAPDPRGGTYCVSGPCYVLCSVPAPTVKEASSGRRSPAVWESASSGHMGSTLGRRARESRKATWEKAAGQPEPQSHLGEERPEAVKSGLEITASRLLSCPARGSAGRQARPRSALHWRGSPREWHSLSNLSFFVQHGRDRSGPSHRDL